MYKRQDQALRSADTGAGLQHINTIAGFDAVWEIDIFGKFRREFQAVRAETGAARAARYEVLTSVIGNVVRAYVDLRGFQVRAGILHHATDVLRESLRIVTIRYERGTVSYTHLTAKLIALLRQDLPKRFAELQFFFQPADIVDQVLNFGQPAPIDVRISGPDQDEAFALASTIARSLQRVAGVVDSHVFQVPNAPALTVDMDRTLATEIGVTQQEAANNVLVATNSSAQTSPNFWVDPRNLSLIHI